MKNGYVKGEDLINGLLADTDYQSKMAEGNRKWQEMIAARLERLRPFQDEVREFGVEVQTPEDLRNCGPLPTELVEILLRWLQKTDLDNATYGSILLGLHRPKKAFDGNLLRVFWDSLDTTEQSDNLRWNIAYTIAESKATGITDWIIERLNDPNSGSAREWFAVAVAKMTPPAIASETFRGLFDELPVDAAKGLATCGSTIDLAFLESRLPTLKGKNKKEAEKAIKKIAKRVGKT